MSEPRPAYEDDSSFMILLSDVERMGSQIRHDLRKCKEDMKPDTVKTLKELEKALKVAGKEMAKIYDKNNRKDPL